ncbi:MAG: deoxyguanosinetriphosphate triphosphohydrolase family protein [Desulfatibacillaceae bacterium]
MAKSDTIPTEIRERLAIREREILSPWAAHNDDGIRRHREQTADHGYRQNFALDADRILHSRAYTRYIDKTQVFYLIQNDHITHRVLHVQLVSKIARTIARFLALNEDLVEAVALGHDIGHAPFGHDGEKHLSELCEAHGIGTFQHNLQSVQFLDRVERGGRGWNLTLQTLDGILCHDGEVHNQRLVPDAGKSFADLDREMADKHRNPDMPLTPMTLEGCVVRMADTVSYIGRDIEDAIRLGLVQRDDLPRACVKVLGDTNGTIVHNLVTDIITNSVNREYVTLSGPVSEALRRLKDFNLERIYRNPEVKTHGSRIRELFHLLWDRFLTDLREGREDSVLFKRFLGDKSDDYLGRFKPEEMVRDFIAGMTDQYFLDQCPPELRLEARRMP